MYFSQWQNGRHSSWQFRCSALQFLLCYPSFGAGDGAFDGGICLCLGFWASTDTSHLPELTLVRLRSCRVFSTRPVPGQSLCQGQGKAWRRRPVLLQMHILRREASICAQSASSRFRLESWATLLVGFSDRLENSKCIMMASWPFRLSSRRHATRASRTWPVRQR